MKHSVETVRNQLTELNKFADDDWGTTADEYVRIGSKIDTRKRKLAQSLTLIMNTQDATPGFQALPPLPRAAAAVAEKRLVAAARGAGELRLEPEAVDDAMAEFSARIR